MTLTAGKLLGRYEIRSKIGEGGMGEVYLARDTQLERTVALKILPADVVSNQSRMQRFIQEAKAASALNHPNILTIHEIGQTDSTHFIATEYIEGETLRRHLTSGRMRLSEVLDGFIQVASALAAAHKAGIIHRDIKPDNIMIRQDGIVKVLDFGLAKLAAESVAVETEAPTKTLFQTEPGTVVGTAVYMSPEQARGMKVDARTDIFSLGVVLYEMVAGCLPFAGSTSSEVMASILSEKEPQPLARYSREVPAELERIVSKALRKEREQRYQTTKDLLLDLQSLKQQLEFEAKLERSMPPELKSTAAVAAEPGTVETITQPTAHSTAKVQPLTGTLNVRRRGAILAAAAVLILAAATAAYFYFAGRQKATINSIAILPFVNVGADPNTEYLSDGITESLISNLSQLPNLKVMSRSSVFRYKGREIDPQAVGHELKVRAVLTGRVAQRGDNLVISLELVDAQDNRQLWGEQYNRKLSDVLAVQAEISREISEKLRLKLTGEEQKRLAKHSTENTEAYQLYLKGRFHWGKFNEEGLRKAIESFNQAIEADPNYALAYTGLANAYNVQGATGIARPREVWPKIRGALEKARALDDTLPQVHSSLGGMKLVLEWDWPGAERELRRSIELNPNLADAHNLYGYYFQVMGRLDEALSEIKRAQELEPLSAALGTDVAAAYYYIRQYDAAIAEYRKANEIDPNFLPPLFLLGQAYERKGMYDQAIAECQKALSAHGHNPAIVSVLGYVYAVSGKKGEAQKAVNELIESWKRRYFSPIDIALVYAGLGDNDQAFAWLDKAYEARDGQLIWIKVEPEFDSLHRDPRFADLLRRIGLPQ